MKTEEPTIRLATVEDLPAIVAIYNEAVAARFATADTDPWQITSRVEWLRNHTAADYPVYVAEKDGMIAGWLSISPYRPGRQALRFTKEVSYYVSSSFQQQGIGSLLLQYAIEQAPALQVRTYIAIVLDVNNASFGMLEKFGFEQWGHLPDIADFDGITCGHLYYGLSF